MKDIPNYRAATDCGETPSINFPFALRPRDAAVALGIGTRKLWEITADQTSGIPHARFGKAVVYPIRELQDWRLSERKGINDDRKRKPPAATGGCPK